MQVGFEDLFGDASFLKALSIIYISDHQQGKAKCLLSSCAVATNSNTRTGHHRQPSPCTAARNLT